jgi:hypothetical protein
VYDGRVSIVGVGTRRFTFKRLEGAIGARITASGFDGGRLRARGNRSGGGSQRTPAGLAGFTGGRRGVYMVRHIPSSWSSLQERESSCIGQEHRGQHKSDAARRRVDVEIELPMAQQKPALSNSKPRGECVSRYLARVGDDYAVHKEKATHTCRRLSVHHLPWQAENTAVRQTRLKT